MRILILTLAVALWGFSAVVTPWRERASAEKALYYIAYCAEELSGGNTIAPGCKNADGGRCSLKDFLVYTWGKKSKAPPDTTPPKSVTTMSGSDLRGAADLEDKTFAQIFNRVNTAKFNTGVRVWFNADPGKVNGAPDFYRSLAQIGEPIDILDEGATRPITHQVQSIIQLGKDGASSTLALRMKNLEKFRLTEAGLFTELSDNFQIRTRTVSTGIPSQGSFETLDVPATVKANEDLNNDDGHIQKTLEEAMDRYRTRNPTIVEHFDAIHSARQAIGGCGCTLPNFALKKRSPGHFLA